MKKLLCFVLLGLCALAHSQTTTVSATVTDTDGVVWANGTWKVAFTPNPSNPNPAVYNINGTPLSPAVMNQSGMISNSGVLSVVVYQQAPITPVGSSWTLTVCPNAVTACGIYKFTAVGSTMSLSSALTPVIPVPRFHPVSGTYGYADGEAILQLGPGSTYWNVTSGCQRFYNATTLAWACVTGGGGGGVSVSPPAFSVQVADAGATNLDSDPFIYIDKIAHTLFVGGAVVGNSVNVITIPPLPAPWTWDWTTPASALASLGNIPWAQVLGPAGPTTFVCLDGGGSFTVTCPAVGGITEVTGDIQIGPGSGSQVGTLPVVNSSPGTCGDATHSCQVATNAKGLVVNATPFAIPGLTCGVTLNTGLIASNGASGARGFYQTANPDTTPPASNIFQNTTGCMMTVMVSADGGGGGFRGVAYVGASPTPATRISAFSRVNAGSSNPNYYPGAMTFSVPSNFYYGISVTTGGATPVGGNALDSWSEAY